MLDEALQILTAAWSGHTLHHRGEHYTVDGVRFLPQPVRQTVPVWIAGFPGNIRPLRRAARWDGFFPVNLEHPGRLAEIAATIAGLRRHATSRGDIAVALPPGTDLAPYADAGATWWLAEFQPEAVSLDQVRGVSTFARDRDAIYHCYSSYARGTEFLMGFYAILDRAPTAATKAPSP
jgi:alkanesulfonate monooxygenase SsuD/methylene tetrahydromethanopterin reductase-like flavin-dependent oxidoreductase (luciferase family)